MISPEVLRRYQLFGSLSDEHLQQIASIAKEEEKSVTRKPAESLLPFRLC